MGRLRELSARPGARRRWAVVAVVLAVLIATPAVLAARPTKAPEVSTASLIQLMKSSADSPIQGYAETSGRLSFPDLGQFGDIAGLLSQTTRLRIWAASSKHYRIDMLSTAGEHDYYRDGQSGYEWNSGNRFATVITRYPGVTQPSAPMVTPQALGRRVLDGVALSSIQRIGTRRDAGHVTIGLRVPSSDPRSLVDHVDVWVDPDNGQPLAVSIVPRNPASAAFDSRYLNVSYTPPSEARLSFHPEQDPTAIYGAGVDGSFDNVGNHASLPKTLSGLPQRSVARDGTATYGNRYSLAAVFPVDPALVYALRDNLDSPSRPAVKGAFGEGSEILTPLVSGITFTAGPRQEHGYLVVSTLTRPALEKLATDLARATR
jgi:hypothetical protein